MVRDNLPDDLGPHEARLFQMIRDALARYMTEFGSVRATTSTIRGERNNIHDCMTAVAKTRFLYVQEGNLFLIIIGRYRIRLKKFSVRLETANYPTQGSFNFENQITYSLFPEMEPININVGYVPDQFDPRNSTVWMTQPGPDGWEYQMTGGTAMATTTHQFPVTDPNAAPTLKSRIKPKQTKHAKLRKVEDAKN